jgi:Sigma-70, region 4
VRHPPTMAFPHFCVPGRDCLASPIACWAAWRKPKTSCRTSGFGGRPLIVLQSARARREGSYASQYLTEPIDTSADPAFGAERAEALKFAVLLLLEKLSSAERAAYVLREAFNYPYRKIADILRMKETNVRQVVTRARVHVSGRRRVLVRSTLQHRLFNAFVAASRTGDLTRLEHLLVSDVISNSEKRCGRSLEAFDNLVEVDRRDTVDTSHVSGAIAIGL